MEIKRKIAMVVNHVKMNDEDELDVKFWLSRSPAERLAEVCRLRRNYYTSSNVTFPVAIEKVIAQRKL